ncbi:MAG TPA: PQQ-binding-like beta-propeller repeat protein [Verrucomicrobiae bacterium]|nr:PQQ-binding-like beta-propeller repeat protein [Verrucomicrobiae bacterium]
MIELVFFSPVFMQIKPSGPSKVLLLRLIILCCSLATAVAQPQPNWPAWRGPHDNGSAEPGTYPSDLNAGNALWKADLPGKGCSTPIIWNKEIFLTAPTNNLDAAFAFDWNGKPRWVTAFGAQSPGAHRNGSGSNPSAVTDGKGLFVRFKSGTLAGLDLDGNVRWQTNLISAFGPENLYWDQGTSPVLTGTDVIVARMHGGDSWLAAFDKLTGGLHWKVARNFETPVEGDHAYDTPLLIQEHGRQSVLVWGAQHLTSHDIATGKMLWSCDDFNPQAVPNWPAVASPVVCGDIAIVACGRADRGQPRLYGIKLGGAGDVTVTHRAWKREDTGTFVPTPAVADGELYILRDRGELECLDPASGETRWKDAFPKSSHNFYASPLIAGDKLYAAREDGVVFVASIQPKFELLSENKLGEQLIASPVAVANRLFLRGEHHLFCFASGSN